MKIHVQPKTRRQHRYIKILTNPCLFISKMWTKKKLGEENILSHQKMELSKMGFHENLLKIRYIFVIFSENLDFFLKTSKKNFKIERKMKISSTKIQKVQ